METTLKPWKRPECYIGPDYYDYYSTGISQHRDSDVLDRANFITGLKALEAAESIDDGVLVVSDNHFLVGWVEYILVHKNDAAAIKVAEELQAALEIYPILNEHLHSQMELEECEEAWACMSLRERIKFLARHRCSIFAARREYFPGELDDNGGMQQHLLY